MNPRARLLRCWAEIDLAALERNLRLIRASLPPHMRYVAVVKADAYGHGVHHVAARLMHAGADLFAVANITEAAALREIGPGWPILILSPLLPGEEDALAEGDLAATISSVDEVMRIDAVGKRAGKVMPVHLKIDTGMGRAGVWHEEASAMFTAIAAAPHVRLAGVFTHFASPDDDPAFTAEQRRRFLQALGGATGIVLSELFIHADNSAGIETLPGTSPFKRRSNRSVAVRGAAARPFAAGPGADRAGLQLPHPSRAGEAPSRGDDGELWPDAHPAAAFDDCGPVCRLRGRAAASRQQPGAGAHPRLPMSRPGPRHHGSNHR
jgi:hypothetical protein